VTDKQWLASEDPARMLRWLLTKGPATSDRKLRLLMCHYLRGLWAGLDERNRLLLVWQEDNPESPPGEQHDKAGWSGPLRSPREYHAHVQNVSCADRWASGDRGWPPGVQAGLLREVMGNPFRPVPLDPAWRTPAALSLAQAAYDERQPDRTLDPVRLQVLADALEEAGSVAGLVEHLRSPEPHVRGCWALDLVLLSR
jgi:hypothetical protein